MGQSGRPGPRPGGQGSNIQSPVPPPKAGLVTVAEATRIIDEGSDDTLIQVAKRVAEEFRSTKTTKTSARRLYTEVRQIEAMWRDPDAERRRLASRRATLLRARIAYQAGRPQGQALRPVQSAIDQMLDRVVAVSDPEERRKRFLNLVDFYEALIAFNTVVN